MYDINLESLCFKLDSVKLLRNIRNVESKIAYTKRPRIKKSTYRFISPILKLVNIHVYHCYLIYLKMLNIRLYWPLSDVAVIAWTLQYLSRKKNVKNRKFE